MRRGVVTLTYSVTFFFLFLFLLLSLVCGGVKVDELNIAFPGDKPQTFFAIPVLVAGRWQYVNVTLNESVDELTISLYKGVTVP